MTKTQFRAALAELDIPYARAAKLFRQHERTVFRWSSGATAVPEPVAILLRLMLKGKITFFDVANI